MITIERATTDDASLLVRIAIPSFLESHGHSASAAEIAAYVAKQFTEDNFRRELAEMNNVFHIIYFDGVPAGYSKIMFDHPTELTAKRNTTKLERIYLLKEFYGHKLGYELFHFLLAQSKQAGQSGVWLMAWTENERAVAFYKKQGMKIIGSTGFKISEMHYNPNHIMYLEY